MNVELSHRLAKVVHQPPINDLDFAERRALRLACYAAAGFDDLAPAYQRLILDAEAARDAVIAAKRQATGITA